MSATAWLDPVRAGLDALDHPKDVFFRDDRAGSRDDRLEDLLEVFSASGLVCDVAVVPDVLTGTLVASLTGWSLVDGIRLHQDGWSSTGLASPDGPRSAGPTSQAFGDVARGRSVLQAEFGALLDDVVTLPVDRWLPELGAVLLDLGVRTVSADPSATPLQVTGLAEVPVSVDWSGHGHGVRRTREALGRQVAAAMTSPGPLGIGFHHAVTDRDELVEVRQLLGLLAAHPNAATTSIARLGPPCRTSAAPSAGAVFPVSCAGTPAGATAPVPAPVGRRAARPLAGV